MKRSRLPDVCIFVFVVTWFTLGAPGSDRSTAQSPPTEAPRAVRQSAAALRPVPAYRVFPPEVLHRLAERARDRIWSIPEDKTWPTDEHGRPVVETERVDTLYHTVNIGETLDDLTRMYRTSRTRLADLNPETNLENLEDGDQLIVWTRHPRRYGVSYGATDWGRLFHGEPLPDDPDYEILFHHRTFGTYYTVSETRRVMEAYHDKYPDAHELMIGDISFRTGGAISPHKSHKSGRDIDISYPRLDEPPTLEQFNHVRRDELDAEKTFFLIQTLISGGHVEYIFMDRWFQRKLYRVAERRGAPDEWLAKVFEYPDWGGEALVRHSPGHRNHMHIRFQCQPTDRRCR